MDEKVTLKINGAAINFNVTADIHERLIDEMNPANKIAPMHNFLIRAVESESKEALDPFLKNPSSVMEIGGKVLQEFSPKLKITVGE